MKFDGLEGLRETQLALPSASDPTRTSEPELPRAASTAVPARVAMAPQLRDQRYDILSEHGRGGLGRVSRAHDRELGRDIAIKELISRGPLSEVRFLREALITARLEHPGIVPVYEAGRWADGTPFYAMKLVAGRPLRDLIAERRTVDERIGLLHHVIAVADAIAYAHGRSIIHRDLKPSNVIVGDFGETVVIDWGLAKDLTAADEPTVGGGPFRASRDDGLTSAGSILGTPAYMAPEQARGEPVDQRADVHAIGAMLWELCSLHELPPGSSGQRRRLLRRAGIDPDLITIIEKACDPDPARRYPDAGALAADLKAFKAGARIAARRYSPWALLVRWTRRRRVLALSIAVGLALAATGSAVYVRGIAIERDRADAALAAAERERSAAASERDRAQLSEAAMWLEKDPTHARDLLGSTTLRSPQRALVLAQAENRSATRVAHVDSRVESLHIAEQLPEVGIVTNSGKLVRLDLESGAQTVVDHELTGPFITRDGRWCYSRAPTTTHVTVLSGCGAVAPPGTLLQKTSSKLAWVHGTMYALDAGELYRLDSMQPVGVAHHVRGFAGSDQLSLMCTEDGRLQIARDPEHVESSTCALNESEFPLAARGEHYVALQSAFRLISDRGTISLPVAVKGEYSLALGDDGLIALADFTGDAWLVRPNSLRPEPVAQRAAHPRGVVIDGSLVASGYSDGAVVVVDVASGQRWEFIGHAATVWRIAIDLPHRRVITGADSEIRVWQLRSPAMQVATELPCVASHILPTGVDGSFAADCSDGRALTWSPSSNHVQVLHQHRDVAFGEVMRRGEVCTAGWDGRVLCTPVSGGATREVLAANARVKDLVSCRDQLFVATADGAIWRVDRDARILYRHSTIPYRIAIDDSCTRLASGAYDGSLIVYDLVEDRIALDAPHAHDGLVTSVVVRAGDILTSGADASIKRWQVSGPADHAHRESTPSSSSRTSGPVTRLRAFSDGWAASVGNGTFLMQSATFRPKIELALGRQISDITLSPDERYVAIADLSEIVVIDRWKDTVATEYRPGSDIACVRFISPTKLAACDRSNIIVLSLDSLTFSPMNSTAEHKS